MLRCHSCFDGNRYPSLILGVGDIFFFFLGVFVAICGFFFQPLFCPLGPLIGPFDDKFRFGGGASFFVFFPTIGAFSFGDTLVDVVGLALYNAGSMDRHTATGVWNKKNKKEADVNNMNHGKRNKKKIHASAYIWRKVLCPFCRPFSCYRSIALIPSFQYQLPVRKHRFDRLGNCCNRLSRRRRLWTFLKLTEKKKWRILVEEEKTKRKSMNFGVTESVNGDNEIGQSRHDTVGGDRGMTRWEGDRNRILRWYLNLNCRWKRKWWNRQVI